MARRCKACGATMTYVTGEHYRETGKGRELYTGVRQYTCPQGCPGAFYDFHDATPVGKRKRILGIIPVPQTQLNVIDPLLLGGLAVGYLIFVAGALAMEIPVVGKLISVAVVTLLAFALLRFMRVEANGEDDPGTA